MNAGEPTFDQLVAFAIETLGGPGRGLTEPEIVEETVREAYDLWLMLYQATLGDSTATG